MIGERVRVLKQDGSAYFGIALRWEGTVLVVQPEDGSAVEKRAYPGDQVAKAYETKKYKLPDVRTKVDEWKSKFPEMS